MLPLHRSLPLVLAVAGLTAPAAATAQTRVIYPTVKSVLPMRLPVGQQLTIRGTGFLPGHAKTTVVFQRKGKPAVFVKADSATTTKIVVTVPDSVGAMLAQDGSAAAIPTRFNLRVLARHFAKVWTRTGLSPLIYPRPADSLPSGGDTLTTPTTPPAPPTALELCLADAQANPANDNDHDGLSNSLESSIGTNPCVADTDGDGVPDGYEYESAKDLNGQAVPYPGTRPFPNPLDPSDANEDFDGDGLTMAQEFKLWDYLGHRFNPDGSLPVYSDGTQNTGGPMPATTPALQQLDLDHDGNLTDDERDADGDGLSNVIEFNTRGVTSWWTAVYKDEKPYTWRTYGSLDPANPDTDGNGIPDGQDDEDHDGYNNIQEMQLTRAGSRLFVQPFNPCLPNPYSLTCGRYVPTDPAKAWPPFDGTELPWNGTSGSVVPFVWPTSDPTATTTTQTSAWNGNSGPQGP